MTDIKDSREYAAISKFYGTRRAKRSNVLLMNHINEGLYILKQMSASNAAQRAFCLHPIFQNDADFAANRHRASEFDSYVMLLVMEYRRAANAYLCSPRTDSWTLEDVAFHVGPLIKEVNDMLLADKVQNERDFDKYHTLDSETTKLHPRAKQLSNYFRMWWRYLDPCTQSAQDRVRQ